MIIKTTICGSNPQIIRVLYIDEKRQVGDLLTAIAIAHGWDQQLPLELVKGEDMLKSSAGLECLLGGREEIYIRLKIKKQKKLFGYRLDEGEEEWILRVEVDGEDLSDRMQHRASGDSGKNPPEDQEPRLIRFRGLQPDLSYETVAEWNYAHQSLLYQDYPHRSSAGRQMSLLVDPKIVNRLLHRKIVLGEKEVRLNRNCCHDSLQILEGYTVENLKDMIREHMWRVNTNQRKRNLIYDIRRYLTPDYMHRVIKEMELEEYQAFRKLCMEGNAGWEGGKVPFPLLRELCLLDNRYAQPFIPHELMDYYKSFLTESGDEDLIIQKKVRKVIRAASNLYGVFTKAMCKQLTVIMYPGEIDPRDVTQEWHETDRWKALNKYTMYSYYEMDELSARELMDDPLLDTYGYYIPSREEAFLYAEGRMNYPAEGRKRLQDCLSDMKIRFFHYWHDTTQKENIIQALYHMSHLGIDSNRIRDYLKNQYYLEGTSQQYNKLLRTVDQLRDRVRTVDLHGYTEEEIRNKEKKR